MEYVKFFHQPWKKNRERGISVDRLFLTCDGLFLDNLSTAGTILRYTIRLNGLSTRQINCSWPMKMSELR